MKARYSTATLLLAGTAVSLICGATAAARAGELQSADPFAAVQTIEQGDLDGLRGGDIEVTGNDNQLIDVEATNNSTNSIGSTVIDTHGGDGGGAGGHVYGGSVTFGGNALQNFGGVYTSAINTAPGGIATALTSMTITLTP